MLFGYCTQIMCIILVLHTKLMWQSIKMGDELNQMKLSLIKPFIQNVTIIVIFIRTTIILGYYFKFIHT